MDWNTKGLAMYRIAYEERLRALGRRAIEQTSLTLHRHYHRQVGLVWEQMDKDVVWIGPLRTQYVTGLDKMIEVLEVEREVVFHMENEEYQVAYEDEDTCLVVGAFFVTADQDSGIFMRCLQRVSFFYKLIDGHLKILQMHLSHPYEVLERDEPFPFRFGKETYDYIAQTHKLAFLDNLTGIGNRNAYETDLLLLSENMFAHKSLGIAIFDLNNLKIINDTQGHLAGDQLIRAFGKLLRDAMPPEVKVYRYGGDEFAALFQNMNTLQVKNAFDLLENLKEAYNSGNAARITFASGCSFFDPVNDASLSDMVCRADAMLYANKKAMKQLLESYRD